MANQDNKSFVDVAMDAHKNMVDTLVENTRKATAGNTLVSEAVEKSTDWYKNWLNQQQETFGKTAEKATEAQNNMKENATQAQNFFQNWYNNQINASRQMWETSQNWMKNFQQQATNTTSNPTAQWNSMMNNWMNGWNSMMNGMNAQNSFNNWMNTMQTNNPFSMDGMKSATDNWNNLLNQWQTMLQNSFGDMQKTFQNGTTADTYRNMLNATEGFNRFYKTWAPMWQSIQEKSFNMDLFRKMMNPAQYKELMDQYFGFMPEEARQWLQQAGQMGQDWMKQNNEMMGNAYQQFRGAMHNMMPASTGREMFGQMLGGYETWYNQMNQAMAPMTRMLTPNQQTKDMMQWQDIANRMMVFNIKNAEMQYMMYARGAEVMDELAQNVMNKMQHGEEIKSMMDLYQEWINISDKSFVNLFESDEYSQIMAEVSALQMKLRKDVEQQMEKGMANIPVATRSELDELYKTIYDLKKQVRQLERMMEMSDEDAIEADANDEKNAAKTTAKKK